MTLRCIIVDDEPLALSLLESYVMKTSFLSLRQKFTSAVRAVEWLEQNHADLAFLDVQMPDINGLDIAKKLSNSNTRIIFTTAFSQYAIEGYKVSAIDYLLKPFIYNDFLAASEKALQYFQLMRPANASLEAGETLYVHLKVGYETVRVDTADILYLESAKDYVKVFIKESSKPILAYTTLKDLISKLPVDNFIRIHRSFVVAKKAIQTYTKSSINISGVSIPVTENYRDEFVTFIKNRA